MAAVDAAPDALEPLLANADVVAANFNAPQQTVLSGPREHVDAAVAWCRERDIGARLLPVACAFHSPHVAAAQRRFVEELARTPIAAPRTPVYSNTTGDRHPDDGKAIAAVLGEHLVRPVEFVREVEAMHRDGARVFVEVGPRAVLTGLVGRILGEREHLAVPVDRPGRAGLAALLQCLAALASEGAAVNVERLFRGRSAKRIDLAAIGPDDERAHRPGTWLVDGGRAWPADAPPSPPSPEEQPVVMTPPPQPVPANGDRAGDVMARYQQVMQRFLDTQSSVMLAYLGAPRRGRLERRG